MPALIALLPFAGALLLALLPNERRRAQRAGWPACFR